MAWYQRPANKYGAKRTEFNGRAYDSKGEAGLAQEIDLLVKAGEVVQVEPQRTFALYGRNGGIICRHRVDFFLTFKDGHQEVWEYKGRELNEWKIKASLFVDNYSDIPYWVITSKDRKRYGTKSR
jgi:hypothetical protein